MVRRGSKQLSRGEVERHLLHLEALGVLDRSICYQSIMTDEEDTGIKRTPGCIPPRLFYVPSDHKLVHCYGDPEFYEKHPEYVQGGLSYVCYFLDVSPRHLDNYYAMQEIYQQAGVIPEEKDQLSMRSNAPARLTRKEYAELSKRNRQMIKDRVAAAKREASKKPDLRVINNAGE